MNHFLRPTLTAAPRCGLGLTLLLLMLPLSSLRAQDLDPATDVAQQTLKVIVDDWTDLQKSFRESDSLDSPISNFERRISQSSDPITRLPDSNPRKAEMMAVLDRIKAEFPLKAKAAQGALEAKHLTENWERDSADGAGWEKETPASFAALLKQQSEAMSRLGMPKTVEWHGSATRFLADTKPETDDAAVKALLEGIAKSRDAARVKLTAAAGAILDEAGKLKLNQDSRDRVARFGEDDLRIALEAAPETAGLQARAAALVAAFDQVDGHNKAAVENLSENLNQHAASAWPALAAKVETTTEFDAAAALKNPGSFKGKRILLTGVPNRMGWDFKTGAYDFALHRDGTAVVGKYDPAVKQVVADTKKRLGLEDLPEEDYSLIAEVAGTAKATVFQDVEGEIKAEGTSASLKVSGRRETAEEAVLLHIIGLHVGPVAVVAGAGAVQADGSVAAVAGPSGIGSTGGVAGFFRRFLWSVLGLGAGLLALLHARFPVLEGIAPLQKVTQRLGAGGMTKAGLGLLGLGLILLMSGFFFHGLLLSLGIITAGLLLSLDFFTARQWLPEKVAGQVRSLGSTIGLTVMAIAALHLLFGGSIALL